jgi:hypothetical protein
MDTKTNYNIHIYIYIILGSHANYENHYESIIYMHTNYSVFFGNYRNECALLAGVAGAFHGNYVNECVYPTRNAGYRQTCHWGRRSLATSASDGD